MYLRKRFYKDDYLSQTYVDGKYMTRKRARGFPRIIADLVDHLVNSKEYQLNTKAEPSLVEIGIGTGNIFEVWDNHFRGKIYGLDVFHPHVEQMNPNYKFYYENIDFYKRQLNSYKSARSIPIRRPQVKFFYGFDGYDETSIENLFQVNGATFDIVIDDSDTQGRSMEKFLPTWKNYLSMFGLLISETIYGNGTPELAKLSDEERLDLLRGAANQGYICFDTSKYADIEDDCPKTNGIVCKHLAVWSPKLKFYEPVFEKHADCIIKF